MSIEVLTADAEGGENLQRWAAMGLPVPPSWRLLREAVMTLSQEQLISQLRALPRMFDNDRYWVLQQGPMNPESRRESLLNLDSDEALASALQTIFDRDDAPAQVVIQALPQQQAAGVLFTRHPLRQDLTHGVVEGEAQGNGQRQRLIFDHHGRLVHRSHEQGALDELVGRQRLLHLQARLQENFDHPQAGEWVFDGEQLWLLQTLPVGSLASPHEAWYRRAGSLFPQAVTPLWYTLSGRWLKTAFWQPLVTRQGWASLDKVEPYRRQHSHIYTNSAFFRQLQASHPGARRAVPPAWQNRDTASALEQAQGPLARTLFHWRQQWTLRQVATGLRRWRLKHYDRNGLWRALMHLDGLGETLAALEGELNYVQVPDRTREYADPLPLAAFLSHTELALVERLLSGQSEELAQSGLRPGADPVHAALHEGPAQAQSLRPASSPRACRPQPSLTDDGPRSVLAMARQARSLRFALSNRLRQLLQAMGALMVKDSLLAHPDDVHFLYFDELWQLWMESTLPKSIAGKSLSDRKIRYLEDAIQGAPDWMIDQVGYGYGGGQRLSPLLRGLPLVEGQVEGPIKRVCSAWALNRIAPGDIVVLDQVEPAWLPWLVQAGGLVLANDDATNMAASLAKRGGIPAIWGVSDVMHSVRDDHLASLDGQQGSLNIHPHDDTSEEG